NFRYKGTITKLQKGHKNPNKPLTPENTIPQCQKCNRPDRNYWIYDDNGRVVSIATPRVVLKSNKKMKKEIYELLKKEFGEK
ncbi:hypothetical protein KAU15_07205, partial [candidate division WOR-3 bacterium]|nr:hypothetical protein [candidate division WOR-3 bacterium]